MVSFPAGFRLERLDKNHPRARFRSGVEEIDQWLSRNALQQQKKQLSVTRVLLDESGRIAGFYSLATGQIDFGDLPPDLARKLPRRNLPIAILVWLGVSSIHQGHGLCTRLFAQALNDCYAAGQTFAFIAVIIDCLNQDAKRFYQRWDFEELPGNPFRLYLSAKALEKMIRGR